MNLRSWRLLALELKLLGEAWGIDFVKDIPPCVAMYFWPRVAMGVKFTDWLDIPLVAARALDWI